MDTVSPSLCQAMAALTTGPLPCHQPPPPVAMTRTLGRTRLELPDTNGSDFFHLTTHQTGRTSLRHCLSDLRKLRNYTEVKLEMVNNDYVTHWSHRDVASHLEYHLSRVTTTELTLTVRAKDEQGRRHILEVTFEVICEDGSLGDHVRRIYEVIVRVKDKIISTPDVTDVEFKGSHYIRIRHGAQTGYFLKEGDDHTLCMAVPPCENNDYVFKCFNFVGNNQKPAGDGDSMFPKLCVLQQPRTHRCVSVSTSSSTLQLDDDSELSTNIHSITKPDHHFFILYGGDDRFCLRPLILDNYYLCYDAVKGLRVQKCKIPPYKSFADVRYYTFEFVPADYKQ